MYEEYYCSVKLAINNRKPYMVNVFALIGPDFECLRCLYTIIKSAVSVYCGLAFQHVIFCNVYSKSDSVSNSYKL